jgi:hemerythrin-like metal-binding protein
MADDWAPASVGVEQIDAEHRLILRRVRGIASAVEHGQPGELHAALRNLGHVLQEHWRSEEAWMAEQGYPGAGDHAQHHEALLERVIAVRRREGSPGATPTAAVDLARAVEEHMRTEDLKLGRFYAARENFRRLGSAKVGEGPALTPIPGALTPVPGKKPPGRG